MTGKSLILEKIKKEKTRKSKNDLFLKFAIIIILCGYVFFFLSNWILPKIYKKSDIATIGTQVKLNNSLVTMDSWEYSASDKAFLIILEIESFSLEKNQTSFILKNGNKIYDCELINQFQNFFILEATNIPRRWTEVGLTVTVGKENLILNMNDKNVQEVDSLPNRSEEEIKSYVIDQKIKACENTIKVNAFRIASAKMDITRADRKIEELKNGMSMQTEEEKRITENGIAKIESEKRALLSEVTALEEELKNASDKITILQGQRISETEDAAEAP